MTNPDTDETRAELARHRALTDWLEAEALVTVLRRSAAAADERASDRARAAAALAREGRRDAYALGVADAAEVLAHRAEVERRRLEAAQREESRLRARAWVARGSASPPDAASPGPGGTLRCG